MTSNTNVELAQKYFELSNNRDLDGIEQILTDSTTYSSPNVGVFLGVEQIMEMKHKFYGSFREMSWQVNIANEIRPGVVEFDFVFKGTTCKGEIIERPGIEYVIVKDGKLQHIEVRNK